MARAMATRRNVTPAVKGLFDTTCGGKQAVTSRWRATEVHEAKLRDRMMRVTGNHPMVRCERRRGGLTTAAFALVCGLVTGWPTFADDDGSDWEKPFRPDVHTVVLYHFDEGQGNDAYDACGDAGSDAAGS